MTRRLTLSDLDDMRHRAREVVDGVRAGLDPDPDDVAELSRYVVVLVDEVDTLQNRATVARMALDGRIRAEVI